MTDEERRPLLPTRADTSSASQSIRHVPRKEGDVNTCSPEDDESSSDADDNSLVYPMTSGEDPNGNADPGLSTSREGSPTIPSPPFPVDGLFGARRPDSTQSSRWGVLCLLLVVFFQCFTARELVDVVGKRDSVIYKLTEQERNIVAIIIGALLYTLPIIAGLISDTVLPRQRALILALILKLLGSLLTFVAHVIMYRMQGHLPEKLVQVLFWVNILGVAFMFAAVCFFPLFISFGAQQVNMETNAVCSYLRGLLSAVVLGVLAAEGIHKLDITEAFRELSLVVCDVLSVVVFLAAIKKYNTVTTDAGRRRFKEFMQILRAHVPCFCKRGRFDEAHDPSGNQMRLREIQEKRAMDRFHLKKGILLVALLSCGAVAAIMFYLLIISARNLYVNVYGHDHVTRRILGAIESVGYISVVLPVLLLEVCTRCSQFLRNAINDNRFKKLGLGSIFVAFSCLLAGLVSTGLLVDGPENVSLYWLFPQTIICGLGAALTLTSVLEIGVLESGPGLATFLCGLGASLSCISFTAIGIVLTRIDYHTIKRFDYIFYVAFGVMVFTLLVIYIPVSVWYTRVKRQILSLSLSMQERENDAEAPSQADRGLPEGQEGLRTRELNDVVG